MAKGYYEIPIAFNEPINSYEPGSPEREELQKTYDKMWNEVIDIPMVINGKKITTGKTDRVRPPHDHSHNVGTFHLGTSEHVHQAIDAALAAKDAWENMPWEQRASIFIKAAELLAGLCRPKLTQLVR